MRPPPLTLGLVAAAMLLLAPSASASDMPRIFPRQVCLTSWSRICLRFKRPVQAQKGETEPISINVYSKDNYTVDPMGVPDWQMPSQESITAAVREWWSLNVGKYKKVSVGKRMAVQPQNETVAAITIDVYDKDNFTVHADGLPASGIPNKDSMAALMNTWMNEYGATNYPQTKAIDKRMAARAQDDTEPMYAINLYPNGSFTFANPYGIPASELPPHEWFESTVQSFNDQFGEQYFPSVSKRQNNDMVGLNVYPNGTYTVVNPDAISASGMPSKEWIDASVRSWYNQFGEHYYGKTLQIEKRTARLRILPEDFETPPKITHDTPSATNGTVPTTPPFISISGSPEGDVVIICGYQPGTNVSVSESPEGDVVVVGYTPFFDTTAQEDEAMKLQNEAEEKAKNEAEKEAKDTAWAQSVMEEDPEMMAAVRQTIEDALRNSGYGSHN